MSKADFIEAVAKKGNLSKADAKRTVEIVFEAIETGLKTVKNGGKYQIGTFGTFTVSKRAPRMGRNPQTGEAIKIKAKTVVRLRPSKAFKDAILK